MLGKVFCFFKGRFDCERDLGGFFGYFEASRETSLSACTFESESASRMQRCQVEAVYERADQ